MRFCGFLLSVSLLTASTGSVAWAQMGIPYYAEDEDPKAKAKAKRKAKEKAAEPVPVEEEVPELEPPSPVHGNPPEYFWALWAERRAALKDKDFKKAEEVLQRFIRDQEMAGWPNAFAYGASLVREARRALADDKDPVRAESLALSAVAIAPDYPGGHLLAAQLEAQRAGSLLASPKSLWRYVSGMLHELPLRLQHIGFLSLAGVLTIYLGSFIFLVFAAFRHYRAVRTDLRLLTRGATRRWQRNLLLAVLVAAPPLFGLGVAPTLLVWIALLATHYHRVERLTAVVCAGLLGFTSFALRDVLTPLLFLASPTQDMYQAARGLDGGEAAQRVAQKPAHSAQEHYVLGLRARWAGDLDTAETHLTKSVQLGLESAALQTSLGNVYFSRARKDAARAEAAYQRALALDPNYVPAHFNLSQVYYSQVEHRKAGEAHRRATLIDYEGVERYSQHAKRAGPRYVVHAPLDESVWTRDVSSAPGETERALNEMWSLVAHPISRGQFVVLALGCIMYLVFMGLLQPWLKPSSGCPNCGGAASRRANPELPDVRQCGPCYHAFVMGDAEPQQRLQKEIAVRRYGSRRRQIRLLLRLLLPGGSQLLGGASARGFIYLAIAAYVGVVAIVFSGGLPEIVPLDALFRSAVAATAGAVLLSVAIVSYWDGRRDET